MPSPVLALVAGDDGVWAGGLGGVAWYSDDNGWTPLTAGLPVRSVAALASGSGSLFAGGERGIARSKDGGRIWTRCAVPDGTNAMAALALSPRFLQDGTALAATLEHGVYRSTDFGESWQPSSFGLQSSEVLALAWGMGESVIAATSSGLYRSRNEGRAWQLCQQTAGTAFVTLTVLTDGEVLAAPEMGPLLRSAENHTAWSPHGELPADIRTSAVLALGGERILMGTADHGLLLSTDDGAAWSAVSTASALSLAANEGRVFAGTSAGVIVSADGGETWTDLSPPPLHDLHQMLLV
ncbi:MAG: WD40/YVTN/BNR-like repeat-containing protein, partial [Thermomicrobiales bacterium]